MTTVKAFGRNRENHRQTAKHNDKTPNSRRKTETKINALTFIYYLFFYLTMLKVVHSLPCEIIKHILLHKIAVFVIMVDSLVFN